MLLAFFRVICQIRRSSCLSGLSISLTSSLTEALTDSVLPISFPKIPLSHFNPWYNELQLLLLFEMAQLATGLQGIPELQVNTAGHIVTNGGVHDL